ncbi:hypothetical protein SB89_06270 [Corynebacterium glutamicum]|nr:hypothetical protein SB89_06270 [Corynebacterium glutamicum]AST20468.1 hypothetical protein CEY17_06565 [Corynebacterium glutamicum ATCC 14067]KIH73852.1 hypothetical protein SD36_06520 [Corynebacterium glutamicum]OKX94430.1 hypothetical protein AUP72_03745 [Corynebacterium glutamicum]OKX94856.1 hypothetical protein AUP71_05920 [Corynebacterium glutamicum]
MGGVSVLGNWRGTFRDNPPNCWQISDEISQRSPHELPPFTLKISPVTHITPPNRTRSHAIFEVWFAFGNECPRPTWIKDEFTC